MEEAALPTSFGEWVKRRRKELDLTQAELADRAGCSTPALRKIEAGLRRPSKQLAELLARSMGIPSENQTTFIRVARGELSVERLPYPIPGQKTNPPAKAEPDSWGTNLPVQLIPFIGREAELAALEQLLNHPDCRLLTITGLGGVGKTRVTIELASRQKASFPGGIRFVPLASLTSVEFIVPAIAESLSLSISGTLDPLEKLLSLLADRTRKPLLLILDNLEHLLAPTAVSRGSFSAITLIARFFQGLPNLKIIITSLERINLQGEWTFELHGLPYPAGASSDSIENFSASMLFLEHARRIKADFLVKPEERPSLVKICQIVEGNPLAIELAASWVGMFSIDEIASELVSNLDFLENSIRDIPDRHRSLRAALDHSWRLLTAEEQQGLSRLAVFRGGFQRQAANQVAGTSLAVLVSLQSKSLLLHKEDGRCDLNEIVRRYAQIHLFEDPGYLATQAKHCDYYLGIARDLEVDFDTVSSPKAVQVVLSEMDNFRTAMAWGLENSETERALQMAVALGKFWDSQGYWREGLEWLEKGLCSPQTVTDSVRAEALMIAGRLSHNLADFHKSIALLRESEETWRRTSTQAGLPLALCHLGASLMHVGEVATATRHFEEALTLGRQSGDLQGVYYALTLLGHSASRQGNSPEAIQRFNEALAFAREAGDENRAARLFRVLGDEYLLSNEYARAEESYASATEVFQKLGNRTFEAHIACSRGYIAIKQRNFAQASTLLVSALQNLVELGDKEVAIICLAHLALLANEQHLANRAICLLGAIDALLHDMGVSNKRLLQRDLDESLASVQRKTNEPAFRSAWTAGSKMTYAEVIAFAAQPWQIYPTTQTTPQSFVQ